MATNRKVNPMRATWFIAPVVLIAGLAGCLSNPGVETPDDGPDGPTGPLIVDGLVVDTTTIAAGLIEHRTAAGAISTFRFPAAGQLNVPANVFVVNADRFSADKQVAVEPGQDVRLLLPPGMKELQLSLDGTALTFNITDTGVGLFSGEQIIEWFKVQRDEYPNRCNGCPNYIRAQQYFAALFDDLGMAQVEVDPYGTNPLHAEFANVVAYRYPRLDAARPFWLGVGGHYDVVTGTTEGAFDNTAGTLATLEMARVIGQFNWTHNFVFGLWGGEEAGLQGSNFFAKTNPNVVAQMRVYVNLDVSGFSWPGPAPMSDDGAPPACDQPMSRAGDVTASCPDPVVISAGPDGPIATGLMDRARQIQQAVVVDYPDPYFLYEPILVGGQVGGYAGVNAQSDHTAFIAAGVPSYFLFNGNALRNPISIHNQRDTVDNWTKYMVHNHLAALDDPLEADDAVVGEALMARSMETYLWLTFYTFLLQDLGIHGPVPLPA